jgi:hypothetical protein
MAKITSEIPQVEDEVAGADMTHMIVPITSDRGLCGGVNGAVAKATKVLDKELKGEKFLCILGNKGEALLKRTHGQLVTRVITEIYMSPTSFALASEIAEEIAAVKQFDKAHIIYNRFKNSISYDTLVDEVESQGKSPLFSLSSSLSSSLSAPTVGSAACYVLLVSGRRQRRAERREEKHCTRASLTRLTFIMYVCACIQMPCQTGWRHLLRSTNSKTSLPSRSTCLT